MTTTTADVALMAHLMRRAGFGAGREELEEQVARGYENVVEDLLHPSADSRENLPDDLIRRYHVDQSELRQLDGAGAYWMYQMITTNHPLEEKLALFWHGLFATGYAKLNQARALLNQVDMFKRTGFGSFRDILIELSKDPAMIIWLDNNDNHDGAINENYGRELLELFSMGIGNYTEDDIKEASRAFTGWTLKNAEYMSMRAMKDSIWPYGRIAWHFEYREDDHDTGDKEFLGERGAFGGGEIVDIICRQDATARFICTRLFQFFGADEIDERGEAAIEQMMASYFESDYEIRSVLRTLFNSEFFKGEAARYARVKAPVETVVGAVRMAGSYRQPTLGVNQLASQAFYMGQGLLQPPTVEGWHEGVEWIDSGSLVERVNFAAKELGNPSNPGVRAIVDRLARDGGTAQSAADVVDGCLDLMGPLQVEDSTREAIVEFASQFGDMDLEAEGSVEAVANVMRLIASSKEYQLA
ncbi:MAG: DUF1800 domain-containing protein [Dehalococcoidia bacterium]|nr:DUF1800 domain-containing protein [Dehalococcoidia bacterium]